ncbi:MAG: hypothetical protein KTR14_04200 [Vampirovibrio sp.]|nr:hypothetical protein [Vampirovibrio sp.]
MTTATLQQEIEKELAEHKIMIYGKGTKEVPRCGFTVETKEFFDQFGHDYLIQDVLDNPEKRQALSEMTNWPTLPKVFINGKFYGDTDILGPMAEKGELQTLLKETFGQ